MRLSKHIVGPLHLPQKRYEKLFYAVKELGVDNLLKVTILPAGELSMSHVLFSRGDTQR